MYFGSAKSGSPSMIVPIKQNGDRDIIGKLNEAIKVMGRERRGRSLSAVEGGRGWSRISRNGRVESGEGGEDLTSIGPILQIGSF